MYTWHSDIAIKRALVVRLQDVVPLVNKSITFGPPMSTSPLEQQNNTECGGHVAQKRGLEILFLKQESTNISWI